MYIITYECMRYTMKPNVIFLIICAMFFITGCTNNHLNNAMINMYLENFIFPAY